MRAIEAGFSCNNACIFCAQGDLRRLEQGKRAAPIEPQLASIEPGELVAFVGGEPTLHEALTAWISEAHARGARAILLQTNGRRLAYPAYARALRAASSTLALDVSLHGSSAPMHDYHTGVDGSFAQTVTGIRSARAAGLDVGITIVVTRSNFRHLAEVVRLVHGAGARAVHFAGVERAGHAARLADRVIPAVELVRPYLARAADEALRLGLGVRAGETANPPEAFAWFAGLGSVEPEAPPQDAPRRPVALAVLGRPAPALREVRAAERRTGPELRAILPELFENGAFREGRG
jgi:MoaA/NifB/PqqE/SkfB family radical SAM enzyme